MTVVLILLLVIPIVVTFACAWLSRTPAAVLTIAAGVASLALAIVLSVRTKSHVVTVGFLRVDALSTVFLLAIAFVYAAVAVYSFGYLAEEADQSAGDPEHAAEFARYSRRFHVGINAFAWSMLVAPSVSGLALLWVAIEITTVVSALLVALDDTEGATEAAWKYVLIASSGLGIALLATIVMYYAGAQALGESYNLSFPPLLSHAAQLPATPVRLAFVLAVVGFGTKVGLFPVHTWLPDAHAEAPTPVSALLSGALLATAFYAILRYYQVTVAAVGPQFPQRVLLVFGVLSLLLAALYVLEQSNLKRLLAYSSVEHMGIISIGISFGTRLALSGVLLHVLGHAAAKTNAFMGAGVLVRKFGTKEMARMRGGINQLPWSGPMFLVSIFALSALPPFGLFRSEFEIVTGGFADSRHVAGALLIVLVSVAFLGLTVATTRILFQPDAASERSSGRAPRTAPDLRAQAPHPVDAHSTVTLLPRTEGRGTHARDAGRTPAGEPSVWMVVPMIAGVAVLILLGVHPPGDLVDLLSHAANELVAH